MQPHRYHLGIAVAAFTLTACAPSISRQEATDLSREVRPLLDAMCAGGGTVPAANWPRTLAALQPNDVRVTTEGLYAETWSLVASERGVFVPCRPNELAPPGGDPSYRAVASDVYTYYIAG